MKKTLREVGQYRLGINAVRVFTSRDETGGKFTDATEDGLTHITIGLNYVRWENVVAVVLHELTEVALTDIGVRYKPSEGYSVGSDCFVFHMDHNQFSEAMARVAWVAASALPKIASHFKAKK